MAFFNILPNVEYDQKPISFPYSETQYTLVKNFFKRYKLSESSYNFQNFFTEYRLTDEDRIDYLSYKFYGTSEYDWVILISNNILNSYFDLPVREPDLYEAVAIAYENSPGDPNVLPADRIHHYETIETFNSLGHPILRGGLKVEKSFYDTPFKYFDNGSLKTLPGSSVCYAVSNYEYEVKLNDDKRKIYILKPQYVQEFITQYKNGMTYNRSSSYIDRTTKRSGI